MQSKKIIIIITLQNDDGFSLNISKAKANAAISQKSHPACQNSLVFCYFAAS
jgi:hypothetical protein